MEPARLVFCGDLHLGKRPSALPAALGDHGLSPRDLGPAAVWRATVEHALEERAHAVVLAGDVVDRPDDRFEAGRVLESGIARLVEAGIPVLAVVGNHDVDALPRVANAIPDFRLIGRGGQWESVTIERAGVVPCRLVGWSFPSAIVDRSPLASFDAGSAARDVASIGVLHCDLDAAGSPYAPVRRSELIDAGLDAWMLGHVHKPAALDREPLGYLGSMVGLDAGEPGVRGPWLVEVEGPGRVRARHVPLAPVRYETIDCSLDGLLEGDRADVEDEFAARIDASLAALHQQLDRGAMLGRGRARVVVARVRVRGKERHRAAVRRMLFDPRFEGPRPIEQTLFVVEKIVEPVVPDLDLDALAERADAPGLLARRLVQLRDGDAAIRPVVERARIAFEVVANESRFQPLEPPPWHRDAPASAAGVEGERVEAILLRAGTRELEGLLGQEATRDASPEAAP